MQFSIRIRMHETGEAVFQSIESLHRWVLANALGSIRHIYAIKQPQHHSFINFLGPKSCKFFLISNKSMLISALIVKKKLNMSPCSLNRKLKLCGVIWRLEAYYVETSGKNDEEIFFLTVSSASKWSRSAVSLLMVPLPLLSQTDISSK
jgi:hypothetical protein